MRHTNDGNSALVLEGQLHQRCTFGDEYYKQQSKAILSENGIPDFNWSSRSNGCSISWLKAVLSLRTSRGEIAFYYYYYSYSLFILIVFFLFKFFMIIIIFEIFWDLFKIPQIEIKQNSPLSYN
jgi:hypothetical protein